MLANHEEVLQEKKADAISKLQAEILKLFSKWRATDNADKKKEMAIKYKRKLAEARAKEWTLSEILDQLNEMANKIETVLRTLAKCKAPK